jgi:alkanesulfonate monooxygenase SsuD/methylene tetrahydromethanopterin reductase-like flavin-dependent oxidoreductase (luciferase family)
LTVKIGLYATGSATSGYRDLLDQIEFAEDAGFDSVWLRERHFHPDHEGRNFFTSPFVIAAYIAARTRRMRIGMGARILPLDHPIHIAEDGATVDVLSEGRLDFGVARIGENDTYQAAFGITNEATRGRFEEALEVIERAWTQDSFTFEGEHFRVPEVSVYPRPVQHPHPPIYLVGISPSTFAFGARRGLPLLLAAAQTAAVVAQTQEAYRRLLREAGHDPAEIVLPVNRFIYVAESNERAVGETRETILRFIHRGNSVIREFLMLPPEEITYDLLFREVCIFGDADYCAQRIDELVQTIDLRHLILTFNYFTIDQGLCLQSMQRFVTNVLPRLRSRPVPVEGALGPLTSAQPPRPSQARDALDSHRLHSIGRRTQG